MSIAKCNVGSAVYVPDGEYLNGVVLEAGQYARPGEHFMSHEFALTQEQNGLLEIAEVDGVTVIWGACCCGGEHDHET